jgi:hypothetical protein
MEEEDLHTQPLDARPIIVPDDDLFVKRSPDEFLSALKYKFPILFERPGFEEDFRKFVVTLPRLPVHKVSESPGHQVTKSPNHHLTISPSHSREEIINYLSVSRQQSPVADLAFYAFRQMDLCDWGPFLKAVFERNPVSVLHFTSKEIEDVYSEMKAWPDDSIYSGNRLALPDEVVNYKRGDGIEKALVLLNVLQKRQIKYSVNLEVSRISIQTGEAIYNFNTSKSIVLPDSLTA